MQNGKNASVSIKAYVYKCAPLLSWQMEPCIQCGQPAGLCERDNTERVFCNAQCQVDYYVGSILSDLLQRKKPLPYTTERAMAVLEFAHALDTMQPNGYFYSWLSRNTKLGPNDIGRLRTVVYGISNKYDAFKRAPSVDIGTRILNQLPALLKHMMPVIAQIRAKEGPRSALRGIVDRFESDMERSEAEAWTDLLANGKDAPVKPSKRISLNELWQKWCGTKSGTHAQSMLCAAGKGNAVAMLILRLRFVAPGTPNAHILKGLLPYVKGTKAETMVRGWLNKITLGREFTWADLNGVFTVLKSAPVQRILNAYMKEYGLSTETSRTKEAQRKTVDLDNLYAQKCASSAQPWRGSLLCELGMDSPTAKLIGALRFAVPKDANNHFLKIVYDIMMQSLQGQSTLVAVSLRDFLRSKVKPVVDKIGARKQLTWDDIQGIFTVGTFGLTNEVLEDPTIRKALQDANSALKRFGFGVAV